VFAANIPGLPAGVWNASREARMLDSMRVAMVVLVVFNLAVQMRAQQSNSNAIVRAFQLWRGGQPKAAIAILEPLLQADTRFDDARDPGVGWNVLGQSYLDLDRFAEARRAYQHALQILRPIPLARAQYASTLDSMAMVEEALGERDAAKALCEKARQTYADLGDRAGVAITSINLAVIALGRNDFKAARRFVQTAIQEGQHPGTMRADDVAAMDAVKSALALQDRKGEEAISMAQEAIDLWTRAHGPEYFLVANGYLLRAGACEFWRLRARNSRRAACPRDRGDFHRQEYDRLLERRGGVCADPSGFGSEAGRIAHGEGGQQRSG
jgi:tetratricopeptide (TPR) repeat protein